MKGFFNIHSCLLMAATLAAGVATAKEFKCSYSMRFFKNAQASTSFALNNFSPGTPGTGPLGPQYNFVRQVRVDTRCREDMNESVKVGCRVAVRQQGAAVQVSSEYVVLDQAGAATRHNCGS